MTKYSRQHAANLHQRSKGLVGQINSQECPKFQKPARARFAEPGYTTAGLAAAEILDEYLLMWMVGRRAQLDGLIAGGVG